MKTSAQQKKLNLRKFQTNGLERLIMTVHLFSKTEINFKLFILINYIYAII